MNLDQNLAAHFGVPISFIAIKAEDLGISSLTARVNGVLFDVFFNSKAEITFSCPA
jgi:Zn-dependent peptidase ImmA (M78 family)